MAELGTIVTEIGSHPTLCWTISLCPVVLQCWLSQQDIRGRCWCFLDEFVCIPETPEVLGKTVWGEEGTEVGEEQNIL